jgi:hypothetical protein
MQRRAVVHIGIHKTGSSSIQQAVHGRLRELRRCGIVYPAIRNCSRLTILFRDHRERDPVVKVRGLDSPQLIADHCARLSDSLRRTLAADHRVALLSGEELSRLTHSEVERFHSWFDGYDVHVIAYLREPRAWASSQAQQLVKAGYTLQEAVTKRALKPGFRERLSPWLTFYGRDRISVFDFDVAKLYPGGITSHFAEQIGLPNKLKAKMAGVRVNEGLSEEAVAQLSAWNEQHTGRPSAERLEAMQRLGGPPFVLDVEVLDRIDRQSKADVEWVQETFGLSLYGSL